MGEIELKFLLDEGGAKQLRARVKASKLASGNTRTRTLRSVYWDTPEHALKRAGIALRLRRDGRRWVQTVKAEAELHGGLSIVGEQECPAPGGRLRVEAIPEPLMRDRVIECINGAELLPVCETLIRRTASQLSLENGTRAELAIDVGQIHADGRSAQLREAEIELVEGRAGALFDIARTLFPDGGLQFSRLSKAARGYMLAEEGFAEPPLAPLNARIVPLDGAETAEAAARDVLRECFDQVAMNTVVVRELGDAEGPHQLRVGLRRLRSAFSVFSPVLESPAQNRLADEARWLGQEVGRLRDLDVAVGDILRPEARLHPDEPALATLADAVADGAANQRARLRDLLAQSRTQSFLIDLARFIETRGWLVPEDFGQTERLARPVRSLAEEALAKRWKKVRKGARDLETLDAEHRHELRKELKKLRYAAEFFSPMFPAKRAETFLKRLKKLQDAFGGLNDVAMIRAMFSGNAADGGGLQVFSDDRTSASAQRAIGWVIGASQVRAELAWSGAKSLWRDLEKTRPFWK
jgi:triphosphatase